MNSKCRTSTLATTVGATAFVLVAMLVLGGCGTSSSSGSAGTNTDSQDAARVKFAQCLRENGVDIPDNPGQNGGGPPRNIDQGKLQTAMKACQKYQRAAVGNISDSDRQEFQDAFVKFSSCMRQHGVDLPSPGSGGGGPPAGGNQINQNDPKTKAAREACQDKLPQGGPGGGGPGGGGPGG
ncbi:MAG: hypothetical protein ACXWW1_07035 [Aeromicrobium sp.]